MFFAEVAHATWSTEMPMSALVIRMINQEYWSSPHHNSVLIKFYTCERICRRVIVADDLDQLALCRAADLLPAS
jgi:hypothetical protein